MTSKQSRSTRSSKSGYLNWVKQPAARFKSGFQAYYYAYLFHKKYPDRNVKVGIYSLKEVNRGIQFLRNGQIIDPELIGVFEKQLQDLIKEIFDPKVPFEETANAKSCEYCPYKQICSK